MNLDAKIEGLLGVGDVELKFKADRRAYVLYGVNGVGKTKVLEALLCYHAVCWAPDGWFFSHGHRPPELFNVFDGAFGSVRSLPQTQSVAFSKQALENASAETVLSRNTPVFFFPIRSRLAEGQHHSTGAQPVGSAASRKAGIWQEIGTHLRLHGNMSSDAAGRVGPVNPTIEQWFIGRAQATNRYQADVEDRSRDIDAVMDSLHQIDGRVDLDGLQIDNENGVSIRLNGQKRYFSELSSGFASVVRLIQGIVSRLASFSTRVDLRNAEALILIDEIESHLHVQWQATIINKLKELFPNCTFVIATHSPLVLSQLDEGEAYVLERSSGDGVVRTRLIESPRSRLLVDLIDEAMTVDLNELKVKNASAESQAKGKAILKSLLSDGANS